MKQFTYLKPKTHEEIFKDKSNEDLYRLWFADSRLTCNLLVLSELLDREAAWHLESICDQFPGIFLSQLKNVSSNRKLRQRYMDAAEREIKRRKGRIRTSGIMVIPQSLAHAIRWNV